MTALDLTGGGFQTDRDPNILFEEYFPPAKGSSSEMRLRFRIDPDENVAVFEVRCHHDGAWEGVVSTVNRHISISELQRIADGINAAIKKLEYGAAQPSDGR